MSDSYLRLYQGLLNRGDMITNMRTKRSVKVSRLVRMHANSMEDIQSASAGEIAAMFGIDCASGDTFTDNKVHYTMSSMYVPDTVISLAIKPHDHEGEMNFSKALQRFQKEDRRSRRSTTRRARRRSSRAWASCTCRSMWSG